MNIVCRLFGHRGQWSPWMRRWYCRWCHEEVVPE